jgi:hypothetical protein
MTAVLRTIGKRSSHRSGDLFPTPVAPYQILRGVMAPDLLILSTTHPDWSRVSGVRLSAEEATAGDCHERAYRLDSPRRQPVAALPLQTLQQPPARTRQRIS